jgi:predicted Ser/Thr protein kinase
MQGGMATDATVKLKQSQLPRVPQPLPTPLPEDLAPLFPQLEILELLGRGGMGAVYKARQKNLNRFIALKIITLEDGADPQFADRFQREAQALAKLNHPNIVSVFDFGEAQGLFYFLMEFVDGANLRMLIHSRQMKPEAALALIPSFCDALQYAHDEGVVHRDIKPENVLVDKKGRVKIADFGLAKLLGHDAADHTLTRTGMYLGTPRYMAPEQLEKPDTVDHRADIYSLGVVFYEMLTGELPMGRFDPPSRKVQVDVKLDEIVLHALEREPSRRYQQMSEIKTDVQGVTKRAQAAPAAAEPPGQEESEDQDDEATFSAHTWFGRIVVLSAVVLAFFNPWGFQAWYAFAAFCAITPILMSFAVGPRKRKKARSPDTHTPETEKEAEKPASSANTVHPKIETAKRMGFVPWLMRWMFSKQAGPGEWRVVVYPLFVSLGIFCAVGGMMTLFRDRFVGMVSPALGAISGGAAGVLLIFSVLLWRLHCLWRKYRSGEITDDPKRVAWSDMPADIRHRTLFQWLAAGTALAVAAGCFMFVLNDFKTATFISTTNYEIAPHSKKYELLVITPQFEQFMMPGGTYQKRPSETKVGITIHSQPGKPGADKPNTMTVTLPGMVANYWHPNVTPEQYYEDILDLDNLSRWMSGRCGVEMDEAAQKEAKQIMAMLKNFREKPPSCFGEFLERMPALTSEFDWKRWGGGHGDIDMPIASMTLLPTVLLFGPLFAFVLGMVRRNAWERARARFAGLPDTPRAAPRVAHRDLPPDFRSTVRMRMAACTLGLALFAGFVSWAVMNRLATTRHDYHITLQPKSPAPYQRIGMQFSFDTSEWRGEHYDVRAPKFPVALDITLADGVKRDLQIELTSLEARYTPHQGGKERRVILDLEEFRNWLSSEAGLDVKSPDIEKQSAELAALLKRHSSLAPENIEVFQARVIALPSFTSSGWDSATAYMLPASLIPGVTLGVIILVFYLLALRWIRRSAGNEAMARGTVSGSVIAAADDSRIADENKPVQWEIWWFSRSRSMQKLMDITLISVAVLSAVAFLSGGITSTTTASDHSGVVRNLHDVSIGLGDPWLFVQHRKAGTRGGLESGINLIAGSALFGYAALSAFLASIRLSREQKRRATLMDVAADTPQRKFFWYAVASLALFSAGVVGVIVHQARIDPDPKVVDARGTRSEKNSG